MFEYTTLQFTDEFLKSYADRRFSTADRAGFRKALQLLDENERHPSPRVHQLQGDMAGFWSASASGCLRILFERLGDGKKRLIACSQHYEG